MNHFIEIDEDNEGNKYLVIHSGSRNLGKQVADIYQKIAIKECKEVTCSKDEINQIVSKAKKAGKQKDIQKLLEEYKNSKQAKEPGLRKDLCYLEGKSMEDYISDINVCKMYANMSRRYMAQEIIKYIFSNYGQKENSNAYIEADCFTSGYDDNEVDIRFESFETVHNYVDTDAKIIRKGAIRALAGEKVIIPINMRDGSLICTGKGIDDWNNSAPHGAGRILSRSQANEVVDLDEFKKTMEGIYTTSVSRHTLDESPFVYKSMDEIKENVLETVTIDKIIKPIYNCKAGSEE